MVLACLNRGLVITSIQGLECRSILAQKIGVTEPSKLLQPAPMEGKGAYNRSSSVQAVGSLPAVALLERVARAVPLPPMDISATDIRARVARGESISGLVSNTVAGYIAQHHLYRSAAGQGSVDV